MLDLDNAIHYYTLLSNPGMQAKTYGLNPQFYSTGDGYSLLKPNYGRERGMQKTIERVFLILAILVFTLGGSSWAAMLKLAMDADPVSLDPQVQLSGGMLQYSHMVFDPLVRWTPDGNFEPRLAVKWRGSMTPQPDFFCARM